MLNIALAEIHGTLGLYFQTKERSSSVILTNIFITFLAAILGGTLNGVAGGGSFLTFPSLIYANVPPIQANATSTAALWPGYVAAAWGLRRELVRQNRTLLLVLGITSFLGGAGGALLLLNTPQTTFIQLVPYLLLLATVLFALGPLVNARVKRYGVTHREESPAEEKQAGRAWRSLAGVAGLQFIIALYGGYFGGGIGILMLASLGLMGIEDIHEMNAIKNVLSTCINGIAIILFILAGAIFWFNALVMVVGAILGGYGGVYYARKIDQRIVRGFVLLVGCVMTIYFFYKYGFF